MFPFNVFGTLIMSLFWRGGRYVVAKILVTIKFVINRGRGVGIPLISALVTLYAVFFSDRVPK